MKFPKLNGGAARRVGLHSVAGQALALVPVVVGLLFGGLALPRSVPPEDVPRPTIDSRILARIVADDDARAARVRATPLPSPVRAVGSGFRAFNTAEARHEDEVAIARTRDDINRAILATTDADTEGLLDLRAFQMSAFLEELRGFERTGKVSDGLEEYGGTFVERMTKVGWCDRHRIAMPDLVRRAAFKLTWNRTLVLDGNPRFALALDETRALYAFYLSHPHPSESDRAHLEAMTHAARDRVACERVEEATQRATGNWLLGKIGELGRVDPTYPAPLARAAALFMTHDYGGSAAGYEAWLQAHPNGPWTLRVQNHLQGCASRGGKGHGVNTFLRIVAWVAVIGGALCAIVYYAYADLWTLPTDDPRMAASVEPTLRAGDLLAVARHGLPALGDLVRCPDPEEPRRWVVGRMVGVSGGDITIRNQDFVIPDSRETSDSGCGNQRS